MESVPDDAEGTGQRGRVEVAQDWERGSVEGAHQGSRWWGRDRRQRHRLRVPARGAGSRQTERPLLGRPLPGSCRHTGFVCV